MRYALARLESSLNMHMHPYALTSVGENKLSTLANFGILPNRVQMASQASADDPASPDYSPQAPGLMTAERLIDEGSKVLDERMRRRLARAAEAVPPERFLENADGCELQSLFDCYCMTVTNRKLWKQKANSLHSLVTVLGIIKNKFGITKIGDEVVCTSQRNGSDLSKEQQLLMLGAYLASEFSQAGACGHDNTATTTWATPTTTKPMSAPRSAS